MKEKLHHLDGLKSILSLGIVVFHYSAMFSHDAARLPFSSTPHILNIIKRSNYAVEIFFIISGFLIAYNYKEKIKHMSFIGFFKKRIYFLYWSAFFSVILGIASRFLAIWLLGWENNLDFWNILSSLTLTSQGYLQAKWPYGTTSWYIGILILCYCLYYVVSKLSSRNPRMYIPLCMFIILGGWICIYKQFSFPFLYYNAARGYCCFFTGILIHEFQKSNYLNKKAISCTGLIILSFCIFLTFKFGIEKTWGHFNLSMPVFIAPTIVLSVLNIDFLKKFLSIKPLRSVSKVNTALYLIHTSIMSILWTLNLHFKLGFHSNDPAYFCANIIICYIMSYFWYILLEKIFIPKFIIFIKKIYLNNER